MWNVYPTPDVLSEENRVMDDGGCDDPVVEGRWFRDPNRGGSMLIFDSFPDRTHAEQFADWVTKTHSRRAIVCDTEEEAFEHDCFPFEVRPPIVMVERVFPDYVEGRDDKSKWEESYAVERNVEESSEHFGGQFAGT